MYSSLKGLMNGGGGGTASIRRSFPAAPGERIEKGDVVTIYNNELYKNAEYPISELPRFSPDVLYLNNEEESRVVLPIGENSYLYIGTTQKLISIYRVESEAGGLFVSDKKALPVYGVEGINQLQFKPLSEEMGVLCYLEHNTSLWTMLIIRWDEAGMLQLGEPSQTELYSGSMPAIESLSNSSFLLVWHCTKAAPWRLKASICSIGTNDYISLQGDATEIDSATNLYSEFAFSKLSAGMFAASYWVKESDTRGSLITRIVTWNGEVPALGEKSVINTTGSWQVELKHWVLSPVHLILSIKMDTTLTFHPITLREAANIPVNGASSTGNLSDSFYDAVKVSENRFVTAVCYKESGALVLNLFDTTDGNIKQVIGKPALTSVKGSYNKIKLTAVGQSLFMLTFNHEAERDYAYTQALLFKMTPVQNVIEDLNWKEQLVNIWDRGAYAYNFNYCPFGADGGVLAAGVGRLKLFRCAWSPTRFISSGVGEFNAATGDHDLNGRSIASMVLSNGYIIVAYRERDTWHGKLSIFQPVEGGYQPIQSHTFSYSHVDNLSLIELSEGMIALQYKQRINPSYDSKQLGRGSTYDELKVMVASVTSTGLTGKMTTSYNLPEQYLNSQVINLGNGYLLHTGVTDYLSVVARVVRYTISGANVTFTALEQAEYLDYERLNVSAILISPNRAAIRTDYKTILVEVDENGRLLKIADKYLELPNRTTRGLIADGSGGFIQVTTNNTNGDLLELTPYRFANNKLYQYADTQSLNQKTIASASGVTTDVISAGETGAVLYQARWESGRASSLSEPHQTMFIDLFNSSDISMSTDRHYPFPCSEGTLPVFLPLGEQKYFCIGSDPDGNQIYMTAYSDGKYLSYGKPYLMPLGIAVSEGSDRQYIEVAMRGIVEVESVLQAGASYYNGQDGRLTAVPNGRRVGAAITANELLID